MTILPIIDILNNVVTVQNYLSATQAIRLPTQITSDPANNALVTSFTQWQRQVWSQFFQSMINSQIIPESLSINTMYGYGDAISMEEMQNICQSTLFQSGVLAPIVSVGCTDMANIIATGNGYATQLDALAKQMQGADVAQLASIQKQVDTLNDQLSSEQEQFQEANKGMLVDSVSTAITFPLMSPKWRLGTRP